MYIDYYGFTKKPYSLLPNPDFLYIGKHHGIALSVLEFSLINEAGFTVITGDVGTGKTTLTRYLCNHLDDNEVTVGLVSNTHRAFGELLQWILNAYGLDYAGRSKVEQYQLFVDYVISEYGQNRRTVLIIDEAQNMDLEILEELRVLSNINADSDQLLQVVLVGQPQLRDKLKDPSLEQFAQRVVADYHLEPLSKTEITGYIRHRLSVAGGNEDLFDEYACSYIAYFSKGVPRLVNMLCDLSLVYAYTQNKQKIDSQVVAEVVRDKLRGGLTPLRKAVVQKKSRDGMARV